MSFRDVVRILFYSKLEASTDRPGAERSARGPSDPFAEFMDSIAASQGLKWMSASLIASIRQNGGRYSWEEHGQDFNYLDELRLERELGNPYTEFAVKVLDKEGLDVGYVPPSLAKHIARALDAGGVAACYVEKAQALDANRKAIAVGLAWRSEMLR